MGGMRRGGLCSRAVTDARTFPRDCSRVYEPVEQLAEGGFGVVWRAVHRDLGTPAAVKVLHAGGARTEDAAARFAAEARITAGLKHAAIVRVLDHGAEEVPWIAYELLAGPTLRAALDAGPLSTE